MNTKNPIKLTMLAASALLAGCSNNSASPSASSSTAETSSSTAISSSEALSYSATVFMPDGTKATGVGVQWCNVLTSMCYEPVSVDQNGTAVNQNLSSGQYVVHLLSCPTGTTYNPNIYEEDAENRHVDIHLLDLARATLEQEGDNSLQNRYMWEANKAYSVSVDASGSYAYYGFTPGETGTYEIESWAVNRLAVNPTNPEFLDLSKSPIERKSDGGVGSNFKYSWTAAEASASLTFGVTATAENYPTTFTVKVTKTN